MNEILIAPSMMCADFLHLADEVGALSEGGADMLHVDIMDGRYVPNFTVGLDFCRALARASRLPLDIHLMVEDPDSHIPGFARLPGALLTIHPETTLHPLRTCDLIRSLGARPGLAIVPGMPLPAVEEILPHVCRACVMAVDPGYAGQRLIPTMIDKIRRLSALVKERGLDVEIEVDGNVSWENVPRMVGAGARILVAGSSSLFDGRDVRENLRRMREMVGR
jgi:ribulose-phosphate 3-epimerase